MPKTLHVNSAMIETAQRRLAGVVVRTPLVRLFTEDSPADIYLKLENLQPTGSFKVRGARNALAALAPQDLRSGVYTASAGNMAQALAWSARELRIPCTAVVPDTAPEVKLAAIRRLGAKLVPLPFDEWWQVVAAHQYGPLEDQFFIHPACDDLVMAGNGTIGLEVLEDLPDVNTTVVPYGAGGLACGIATALRAAKPDMKVYGAEVTTAAPLSASLSAGFPARISYTSSFVDGIGTGGLLPEMWPLASRLLNGALVASLAETTAAVRLLAERHRIIAEGAAAVALAVALSGQAGDGKIVCIISGGNINFSTLTAILTEIPAELWRN